MLAIGTLTIDEGTITWYSKDEIYFEKSRQTLIGKINQGLFKFRNKICIFLSAAQMSLVVFALENIFVVLQSLNSIQAGTKLSRGFKEKDKGKEEPIEKPKEITHLLFVIHGIAQKLWENSVIKNAEE